MQPKAIREFIKIASQSVSYDADRKAEFHRRAGAVLKYLAKLLRYEKGDYDLRHNQGGIAVSGEITLHSDTLYVQIAQSAMGPDMGVLWRTCDGRKDYCGHQNQWSRWSVLEDMDDLAEQMQRAVVLKHYPEEPDDPVTSCGEASQATP